MKTVKTLLLAIIATSFFGSANAQIIVKVRRPVHREVVVAHPRVHREVVVVSHPVQREVVVVHHPVRRRVVIVHR